MPTPAPDRRIRLEYAKHRWRARFAGHVIADTADALILREADLAPVVYFPRQDVATEYMGRTERHTHAPDQGEASYYTLRMDSEIAENVAWSYQDPLQTAEQIRGRIAFDRDRVEIYEVDDAAVNPHHRKGEHDARRDVDAIVQHTDAGDGAAQREHWPPNVEMPFSGEGGLR